ncbi:MAG: hypothetical protein M1594_02115 [Candidatus Marsarchaeota archaeon]|nr:hypothetical protein [Candidatus Marsarchaeota archaeon]
MKCEKCGSGDGEVLFTEDFKQFYFKCKNCGGRSGIEAIKDDYTDFQKKLKRGKNV